MPEILALLSVVSIGASAVVLVLGYRAIRGGQRDIHHRRMLIAASLAALFLVFYLARVALFGGRSYAGPEVFRSAYLGLLFFHSVIAALNLPLALVTLYFAFTSRFDRHKPWARVTFWNWILVAITGWAVYLILGVWGT